jgi:hypothetical protein
MLRLQQYEQLLKAMVASMVVEGALEKLNASRAPSEISASKKTLGALVEIFTGTRLIATPTTAEAEPVDSISGGQPADVAWASMHFSIAMPPQRHAQTKAALTELVALRNDLVHHLIERFDISKGSGCRAASIHLDRCYEQIDEHCKLLATWVASLAESQVLTSSYVQSTAFEDALVHGINPDGSVCWERSSIVECLREAETARQADGWTSLDAAIEFIWKENRDQIPSRYGCKTWRQVLKKSGQFELQSAAITDGAAGQTWYRSYAKGAGSETAPRRARE